MGIFDGIVLVVFIISILIGISRGFFKEALSIICWILAFWLAKTYQVDAGDFLHQQFELPSKILRDSIGFGAIFISTLIFGSLINYIVAKILSAKALKGVDKSLGALLGVVRAILIVTVVLIVGKGLAMQKNTWWKNSVYIQETHFIVEFVETLLPESWRINDSKPIESNSDNTVSQTDN